MMNKKYTLAIFENCSNRFFGMKVIHVYLDVLILLFVNLLSVFTSLILKFHISSSFFVVDFLLSDALSAFCPTFFFAAPDEPVF
jgi:hypothetical protein